MIRSSIRASVDWRAGRRAGRIVPVNTYGHGDVVSAAFFATLMDLPGGRRGGRRRRPPSLTGAGTRPLLATAPLVYEPF